MQPYSCFKAFWLLFFMFIIFRWFLLASLSLSFHCSTGLAEDVPSHFTETSGRDQSEKTLCSLVSVYGNPAAMVPTWGTYQAGTHGGSMQKTQRAITRSLAETSYAGKLCYPPAAHHEMAFDLMAFYESAYENFIHCPLFSVKGGLRWCICRCLKI